MSWSLFLYSAMSLKQRPFITVSFVLILFVWTKNGKPAPALELLLPVNPLAKIMRALQQVQAPARLIFDKSGAADGARKMSLTSLL